MDFNPSSRESLECPCSIVKRTNISKARILIVQCFCRILILKCVLCEQPGTQVTNKFLAISKHRSWRKKMLLGTYTVFFHT